MNKIIFLLVLILFSGQPAQAEVVNEALGKNTSGTFSSSSSAVDNSIATYASSGNINEGPQFITVDLGREIYVGSVKISWSAGALSRDYSVRVSKDNRTWLTEFSGLDAAVGILDSSNGTISQVVSTRRYTVPSRYLQVYIPASSEASAPQVKICEIQLFEAQNLKFNLENVDIFPVIKERAVVIYKTSMAATRGVILYGKSQNNPDQFSQNNESGVINSAMLTKLDGGTMYFCRVKAWNASGNTAQLDINYFNPLVVNLAKNKDVTGTFTALPPSDLLVDRSKPVLSRIVDDDIGYFGGMATSQSIIKNDQEVTIDLGESYMIRSIVSFWRDIAYPESFSVSISNDQKSWQEIAARINAGEGALIRSDDGDPIRVINTDTKGERARYIQILIPKNSPYHVKNDKWDFVQLMEIEVLSK